MSGAQDWLDRNAADAPLALRERMRAFLTMHEQDAASADVAATLAAAGLAALAAALPRAQDREAALDLLTADALLTCAMQAAAEGGGQAVEKLANELTARLAGLGGT